MNADLSPLELVKAYQDAWIGKNFEEAQRYIADDIDFVTPRQRVRGIETFMRVIGAFADRIAPRWELIAATEAADSVLVVYHLYTSAGSPAVCADYFSVASGKIVREILSFDPTPFA